MKSMSNSIYEYIITFQYNIKDERIIVNQSN